MVGGDDNAGQAGGFEGCGVRRASPRDMDRPFEQAVLVLDQVGEPPEEWVGLEVIFPARLQLLAGTVMALVQQVDEG